MSAPRRLVRALVRICSGGAESGGAACDAGEIVAVGNDETIGKIGGVPAVCEEKTRWRITPSEPSETRTGGTGVPCQGCEAKCR
jgi:hypothetical protein